MPDDIKLPPLPRPQVPFIAADIYLPDILRLADWCEKTAKEYARAAVLADRASRAAQAPAADAHPGYAGVTVWVGDMKCTMTVPAPVLGASRCDALLECFQKARHAIDAAMQRTTGREGGQ